MNAAVRVLGVSWQATAAMPIPTRPEPSQEAPNSTDPATGRPPAMSPTAARAPTATMTSEASSTAEARGADRPTSVAAMSSWRPDSSSVRVCRRTRARPSAITKTAYSTVVLVIANSPRLVTSRIGP